MAPFVHLLTEPGPDDLGGETKMNDDRLNIAIPSPFFSKSLDGAAPFVHLLTEPGPDDLGEETKMNDDKSRECHPFTFTLWHYGILPMRGCSERLIRGWIGPYIVFRVEVERL